MATRKRRRRKKAPAVEEAHVQEPAQPEGRQGPIVIPQWAENPQEEVEGEPRAVPDTPQHQLPAVALVQFYQQIALPLSGVMAAVAMQKSALAFHPLASPELTARFDRFTQALNATHSHAGACLAVLQEMVESETGE